METAIKERPVVLSPEKFYTAEEYFELESRSTDKLEYRNGKINFMPGAQPVHNLIAANIITQLNIALENSPIPYFVLTSDTKIHIPRFHSFVYSDAVVVCRQIELYPGSKTVITNPLLIVEVISDSTENYDKQGKFHEYKQVPSFKEYVLVEQRMPFLLSSYKSAENTWTDTDAEGLDASIHLQSIGCTLALKKIYRGVVFS